jgi:nucleotide-binding universal stress UspA family protein
MKPAQVTPLLAGSERDGDGRLVGLTFDSTPPFAVPTANAWLIAVDGSDNALRAVAHAAAQAGLMNACALHLIHVQPWLAKEAAEAELAHRALGATARARATLDAACLPWRLHVVLGDAAERITDKAVELQVSTIVMGSRGLNAVEGVLFGSVASKVMHHSVIPVLVVA